MRSVSSRCHLGEVEGVRSRRVQSRQSQMCAILASGFADEVKWCDLGAIRSQSRTTIWVRGVKSKLVGCRQWALSSSSLSLSLSLFLSLSLRAGAISLTHSLSLSVFWKMIFEGKIKTKIILHPTHS